ncbi:cytochrome P450 4C1-like isoform X1 [Camponotus floridanus]|uniref:cytochrome P450 4C1-like isoform X1 n=1 Tax=Camponotus floridanus TaxID=104421 RepID=UPI000DC6D0BB|nr:cytochrome P450 4C1-like isoform X1 [Camponotus floridanus]
MRNCHGCFFTNYRRIPATISKCSSQHDQIDILQSIQTLVSQQYDILIVITKKKTEKDPKNIAWIYGKNYCGKKTLSRTYQWSIFKNLESDKEAATNDEVFGIKKKRLAMLDLLLAASQEYSLTDSDIKEEVDTFMLAGHDTIATGIMFTLLLLAEHKDIQERVKLEVDDVMQENGGKLNMRSLQNLSYLDRCLKEALRLYPSVPTLSRYTGDDVKLQSYVVPAGSILVLNIYAVHRDSNFWPNPDVFDPDRFLPEKIENRHPYSYLPFSAGPRNCIGQRFGLLEMKAIVAPLVHNFYLEPVEYLKNIQFKADIIIRPTHPVHVRFIPITCKRKSFKKY